MLMAQSQKGSEPIFEPMMTPFNDEYVHNQGPALLMLKSV